MSIFMYSAFNKCILIHIANTVLNIYRLVKKITENDKKKYSFKIEILFFSKS